MANEKEKAVVESTAVEVQELPDVQISHQRQVPDIKFNDRALQLIQRTIMPENATKDEFHLFLYQCKKTALDPLARQIYCVKGKKTNAKFSIGTTIDGFRLVAERTGEYEGQTKPEWYDADKGEWVDVWVKKEYPAAARIGVYRKGFKEPVYGVARWDSYVQINSWDNQVQGNWHRMADLMLSKCAEALALRKAFPQELSGQYTSDEVATFNDADTGAGENANKSTPKGKAVKTDGVKTDPKKNPYQSMNECSTKEELIAVCKQIDDETKGMKAFADILKNKGKQFNCDPADFLVSVDDIVGEDTGNDEDAAEEKTGEDENAAP